VASNAIIEGIATNGTDIWLVDARQDRVYRYANAASRLSGSQNAASSFALNSGNTSPKDIVTDGVNFWVVNDSTTDRVFKYSMTGTLVGSWTIDSANKAPTGLTIDPSGASQSIWIVDNGTDRVYEYTNSRIRNSGSQSAAISFALASGNTNPQGIADPPPPVARLTAVGSLQTFTSVVSNLQAITQIQSLSNSTEVNGDTTRAEFKSAVVSKQTQFPIHSSNSTSEISGLAFARSLPIASKLQRTASDNDYDTVFSNELFDGLDTSLLESLATAR
jgi:hypothetical protein